MKITHMASRGGRKDGALTAEATGHAARSSVGLLLVQAQ
jgi:hypothetical protein